MPPSDVGGSVKMIDEQETTITRQLAARGVVGPSQEGRRDSV